MLARGHGLEFYSSTFALGADLLRYMQSLALASEACLFAAAAFLAQSLSDISFSHEDLGGVWGGEWLGYGQK